MKRVLFVSKPILPQSHDGSVCLVREISSHLTQWAPTVMTVRGAETVVGRVRYEPVYPSAGGFAPALGANARVMARLLLGSAHELWHFVFAPNPMSSAAAKLGKRLRRPAVVQTIASRPKSFAGISQLLFGDRVVALSNQTADAAIQAGFASSKITVIPPPLVAPHLAAGEQAASRERLGIPPSVPVILYAGDLEFSGGAGTFSAAIPALLRDLPDAVVVFACRAKTPNSMGVRAGLIAHFDKLKLSERVKFAGEVPSLPALVASTTVFAFPVDDLYGKVDLPYAVLEACALGVPVVAIRGTPLEQIDGISLIRANDDAALASVCTHLCRDESLARTSAQRAREYVLAKHDPAAIAGAYEQIYDSLAC